MPFISEAASAIKSRFGFHDRNSEHNSIPIPIPSIRSTPDLQKTSSKQHLLHSSAIRNIASEREDQSFEVYEDPSFWKDHNVQVLLYTSSLILLLLHSIHYLIHFIYFSCLCLITGVLLPWVCLASYHCIVFLNYPAYNFVSDVLFLIYSVKWMNASCLFFGKCIVLVMQYVSYLVHNFIFSLNYFAKLIHLIHYDVDMSYIAIFINSCIFLVKQWMWVLGK